MNNNVLFRVRKGRYRLRGLIVKPKYLRSERQVFTEGAVWRVWVGPILLILMVAKVFREPESEGRLR